MNPIPVEINDLVQVRIPGEEPTYPSRVYDVVEQALVISWPTEKGVPLLLRPAQSMTLFFIREDAIYSFEAVVKETHHHPVPRVALHSFGPVQRVQRREYFRVRVMLPVHLTGSAGTEESKARRKKVLHLVTHTVDISGAGMAIHHGWPIPANTMFDTSLVIEDGQQPLKLLSRVVHSEPLSEVSGKPLYHVALVFVSIKESQRRTIVRRLFKIQLKSAGQ